MTVITILIHFSESMQKDMYEWEQGKIWSLSSYGPIGGKGSIPQFEDLSPEEIRYETLVNSGMPPTHLAQKLANSQRTKIDIVQNRNICKSLIDQILREPQQQQQQQQSTSSSSTLSMLLAKPAANSASIFGGGSQQQSNSIFGQPPANVNLFQQPSTQTPSIFGSANTGNTSFTNQPGSIFGGSTPQTQGTGSMFGQAPFGGQQSTSVFGQPASQQQNLAAFQPSIFGSPTTQQQQPTTSVFGSNTGLSGLFSQPVPPPAQQPQPSAFGASTTSAFGGQQSTTFTPTQYGGGSTFGGGANQNQLIQPNQLSQPIGGSIFGGSNQQLGSSFGMAGMGPSPRDKYTYSEMSELTPEEIKAFEADSFGSCENIPLKAPPKELCR